MGELLKRIGRVINVYSFSRAIKKGKLSAIMYIPPAFNIFYAGMDNTIYIFYMRLW